MKHKAALSICGFAETYLVYIYLGDWVGTGWVSPLCENLLIYRCHFNRHRSFTNVSIVFFFIWVVQMRMFLWIYSAFPVFFKSSSISSCCVSPFVRRPKIEWSDGTGGTVAACFGFSWLWLSCPYSHTKYKQTLKMEPVNTHTNTHIYTVWRLGEESGCQNWRLAERCEMLWHFTSLHFPRLLWMLQQRCQPKRRPVWNIPCTHTHPQSLHACTFTPRHMNYSDSFALFIFHVVVWFLEMSTRQVSGSLSSIPPDAQRKVW